MLPWLRRPVHPRARGEHIARSTARSRRFGSSPRSRGTRDPARGDRRRARFIPALAGNTSGHSGSPARLTVHPRARGEHVGVVSGRSAKFGSSPRSRGTLDTALIDRQPHRFIPALAGNTCAFPTSRQTAPVHPRARGEHTRHQIRLPPIFGSSPRSRGTLPSQRHTVGAFRFIPALAGNTRPSAAPSAPHPVHPRARGEHPRRVSP